VKLVREFMDALRNNRSLVKQMIMGAGKTTTVGPLLALMLGDGKSLVVQVKDFLFYSLKLRTNYFAGGSSCSARVFSQCHAIHFLVYHAQAYLHAHE
jgi:hypothetical protein